MFIIKEKISLTASGARTSDWIGQVKGGILYSYDLSSLVSQNKGILESPKKTSKSTQKDKD